MSMNENQIYRILNYDMGEMNKNRWIAFLKEIFGQNAVGSFDENNSCIVLINGSNNNNNTIKFSFPNFPGGGEVKIFLKSNETPLSFGSIASDGKRGNNLFLKAATGGGLISWTLSNPKDELQYITVNNRYLIFTKVKDLKNDNEYDCCIYEQGPDNSDNILLQIAVFPPNNEDANLINPFSFTLLGRQNLVSIAPYPVLSQTALRFDTYVFPYLFKKETYPECAFGIKKIQGRRYFLTKYLALQLEDEEGGN